jgi:hypothetical protein
MAKNSKSIPKPRTGQGDVKLSREEFSRRLSERFYDPAFEEVQTEVDRVIEVAWKAYDEYDKSPRTRKAGKGFKDPNFELPVEWLQRASRFGWRKSSIVTQRVSPVHWYRLRAFSNY